MTEIFSTRGSKILPVLQGAGRRVHSIFGGLRSYAQENPVEFAGEVAMTIVGGPGYKAVKVTRAAAIRPGGVSLKTAKKATRPAKFIYGGLRAMGIGGIAYDVPSNIK